MDFDTQVPELVGCCGLSLTRLKQSHCEFEIGGVGYRESFMNVNVFC